jgi:hypothetical protein
LGEKLPCPFGCGGTFKRSGLTRHKRICNRSSDEYRVQLESSGELDKEVARMMEIVPDPVTGKTLWKCTQCDYTNKLRYTVKEHVETHISGLTFQCPHCSKSSPTRNALRGHVARYHNEPSKREIDEGFAPLPIEYLGKPSTVKPEGAGRDAGGSGGAGGPGPGGPGEAAESPDSGDAGTIFPATEWKQPAVSNESEGPPEETNTDPDASA